MSNVTDVVLTTGLEESAAAGTVNAWLKAHGYGELLEVTDGVRSNKAMQTSVYIGAFNYLDLKGFRQCVTAAPWEDPDMVRFFYKGEHDACMRFGTILRLLKNPLDPSEGHWPDLSVPDEAQARELVDMAARSYRFQVLWRDVSPQLRQEIELVLRAAGDDPRP